MTRRIVHPAAHPGARLELEAGDLHHLLNVLRARPGLELEVLDGAGHRFAGRFLGPRAPQVEIGAELPSTPIEPVRVWMPPLKGARTDWAIEKLSELGVEQVTLLALARSVTRPRMERLRRIARESTKQCGRAKVLVVDDPMPLETALGGLGAAPSTRFLLDQGGEAVVVPELARAERVVLAAGPEGGFESAELAQLRGAGFRRVRLAAPILRAETAVVAGAALVIGLRQ